MRRLIIAFVLSCAATAAADDDIVLGPINAGAKPAQQQAVAVAVANAQIGTMSVRQVDTVCTNDPGCLAAIGKDTGARRVIAVVVAPGPGRRLAIAVSVVDVQAKILLGNHTFTIAEKKLAKDLAPALRKFLDDAPTEKAKAIYAEASQHFNLGEFAMALEQYKLAYRIKPLAAFQFNIAQCERKLGRYKEAIAEYQSYLAGVPDADNRATVEQLITESKAALADQDKKAREDADRKAKLEAERMEMEKKKAEEGRKAKEAEARTAEQRRLEDIARMKNEKEIYDRHPMRKWMIATSILSAGAIGVGGYFGILERKKQQDADTCVQGATADTIQTCLDDRTAAKHDALMSNAFFIGGGAALLGSIIIFAIDPGNRSKPEHASIRVSPSSIQMVLSW